MTSLWIASCSILLTLLITSAVSDDKTPKTTARPNPPTFAGKYPFVGTLELVTSDDSIYLCVLTAVTEQWAISVQSCFASLTYDNELELTMSILKEAGVKVKLPNFKLYSVDIGEKTIEVDNILLGPQLADDRLVLMHLNTPISKQLASKVKTGSNDIQANHTCVSVGWSPIRYSGAEVLETGLDLQDVSQAVTTNPVNTTVATEIKDHVVWGKTEGRDKSSGICKFETGSPLLCRDGSTWDLVGVAGNLIDAESRRDCSSLDDYAQYIFIKPYIKWIYSEIRKTDDPKETG